MPGYCSPYLPACKDGDGEGDGHSDDDDDDDDVTLGQHAAADSFVNVLLDERLEPAAWKHQQAGETTDEGCLMLCLHRGMT